jgi:hypothetical protein
MWNKLKKYSKQNIWHFVFIGVLVVVFFFSFVSIYNDAKDLQFCLSLEGFINFKNILLNNSILLGTMLSVFVAYIAYYRLEVAEEDNKAKLKQFHFSEWRTELETRFSDIRDTEPYMIRVFTRNRRKFFDKLYESDFAITNKTKLTDLFSIFEKEVANFEKKTTNKKVSDSPASFLDFRFLFLGCADDEKLYENITTDLEEMYKSTIDKT